MDTARTAALAEVCHMMAVFFYDPQEIFHGHGPEILVGYKAAAAAHDAETHRLLLRLQAAAETTELMDLRIDYAALFVGPAELRACPYGSVHLEGERRLYGHTTLEVQDMYAQAGLQLGSETGTVPDHIAVELEFLYYLLHRAATTDPPPLHLYRTFLHHFFLPFAKKLAIDIRESAETDFYRLVGEMLQRLVLTLSIKEDEILDAQVV